MVHTQTIAQQSEDAYAHLLTVFPSAKLFHHSPAQRATVDDALTQPLQAINRSERESIFDKLRQIHKQPLSSLGQDTVLYLEQQLSDMFGISLTTETPFGTLPFLVGQMQAQPHLKQSPTDQLPNHEAILEAGVRTERSFFGWSIEPYGVSLPLHELSLWQGLSEQEKQGFLHQYVVVINPILEIALMAKIVDVGPYHTQRYQLRGTPPLMREGKFWSPGCNGLAAIFFVETHSNSIKTGLLSTTM